ncbi:MAG: GNAT family N-acetyltransferase [Chloroflexota bacterium]
MSEKYHITYLDESEYSQWDRFVDSSPQGSIYSTSTFLRAMTEISGTRFNILAIRKGEEIVGGVGLHYRSSRWGDVIERRGLLFYNGLIYRDYPTKYPSKKATQQINIIRAMIAELESNGYAAVSLSMPGPVEDTRAFTWAGWDVYPQYSYVVPIDDLDALWRRTEQNARRLISRCQNARQTVEQRDDFDCFYTLHEKTYHQHGLEPYFPRETFRHLYDTLRDHGYAGLFFALMPDGRPVSTQIVLSTGHPVTHTWVAGSDRDYAHTGVTALLRWEVFKIYHQRGYAYNDLTDAMNEPVARFKAQLGGDLVYSPIISRTNSRALRLHNKFQTNLIDPIHSMIRRMRPGPSTNGNVNDASEEM